MQTNDSGNNVFCLVYCSCAWFHKFHWWYAACHGIRFLLDRPCNVLERLNRKEYTLSISIVVLCVCDEINCAVSANVGWVAW